jgi:hypothetical protein
MLLGIAAWLLTAGVMYGEVTLETTAHNEPFLAGNLTSIVSGGLICLIVSLVRPDNFDFSLMRDSIALVEDKHHHHHHDGHHDDVMVDEEDEDGEKVHLLYGQNKNKKMTESVDDEAELEAAVAAASEEDNDEMLKKALKVSIIGGSVLASVLVIAWPAPLVLSGYVFSKTFFYGWVTLSLTWGVVAGTIIIILPWWESRDTLAKVFNKFTKKTA